MDGRPGRLDRAGAVRPVAEVDGDGVRLGGVGGVGRAAELEHDVGVLDDDGPAGGGPLGVERDERAPGPEDGEEADDHVGGTAEGDPDDLFGGESALDQMVGQLGGLLVHFTVRQGPVLVGDRDGVRPGARLLPEQLHDGGAGAVGPVVVPPGQGLDARRDAGGGDGGDGPVREVGQIVQGELGLGLIDAVRDRDGQAVRRDLPTGASATAVVDPAEDVGEGGGRGEVDAVGAAARRPGGQADGTRLGDGPVAVVAADPSAYGGEVGGRETYVRSGRSRHRKLSTLPRYVSWP